MDASKQEPAKQLKEHLQHQQEPFSLHNYLSERSYMFKNFSSDSSHIGRLHSAKNPRLSIVRKRLLQAKGILTAVLHKFILEGDNQGFSSSMKRLAASDNFTDNDVGDMFLPYEHQGSTVMNMFQTFTLPKLRRLKRSDGDPMFSTYLRKILMTSDIVKMGHVRHDQLQMVKTTPLCRRKKRIPQKRKQLLYDCVERAKEFHENEGKNVSIKAVSELEDIEKIIQEHYFLLEKEYGEVKKTTHLLHTESSITSEEWANSDKIKGEIHTEIGDAILDDIIREMIDLFSE